MHLAIKLRPQFLEIATIFEKLSQIVRKCQNFVNRNEKSAANRNCDSALILWIVNCVKIIMEKGQKSRGMLLTLFKPQRANKGYWLTDSQGVRGFPNETLCVGSGRRYTLASPFYIFVGFDFDLTNARPQMPLTICFLPAFCCAHCVSKCKVYKVDRKYL